MLRLSDRVSDEWHRRFWWAVFCATLYFWHYMPGNPTWVHAFVIGFVGYRVTFGLSPFDRKEER